MNIKDPEEMDWAFYEFFYLNIKHSNPTTAVVEE